MKLTRGSVLEGYALYLERYPKKHANYLTKSEYIKVIQKLGEELAYLMISTGKRITLPERLGDLQVIKYYRNQDITKYRDHKRTKELYGEHNKLNPDNKKYVYHNNKITRNLTWGIHWERYKYNMFKNKSRYYFRFTRPNMRFNSYNKTNPKIALIDHFKREGYRSYEFAETKKFRDVFQDYKRNVKSKKK